MSASCFPVYIRKGSLSAYHDFQALSHWHEDLEWIYVETGQMQYNVNGEILTLRQGEGLFVNSKQLHFGYGNGAGDCTFLCVLFHPALLCSSACVEQRFVQPVLENGAMPCQVLRPGVELEDDILDLLRQLWDSWCGPVFPLQAQSLIFQLWTRLFALSRLPAREAHRPESQHLTLLKSMIRFICRHYPEHVTLARISQAGHVGKMTCCAIFQKYTGETPVSYLTSYRLKKAAELLEGTDQPITDICMAVGFGSPSHFASLFRRAYRCTPREYRARAREIPPDGCKNRPQQV